MALREPLAAWPPADGEPVACQAPRVPAPRTVLAVTVALPWVVWAAVRTAGLDLRHPVVAALAFTPYAAATSWLPVLTALWLRRRSVALLAAVAAVALVATVLPRALGGTRVPAEADGPTLRVMSANVLFGSADMASVLRIAREEDVDVLALQELTVAAARRLDAAGGRAWFPARAVEARPGAAGSGLFSRLPLRDRADDDATGSAQPEVELRPPGAQPVRIKTVHPRPPISGPAEREWRAAIDRLPRPRGALRVLAGDFNATLDHRVLRRLLDAGYVDAADATGSGLSPTWPRGSDRPPITIDHVLLDERIGVRSFSVRDLPGSDHRAVVAELVLPAA